MVDLELRKESNCVTKALCRVQSTEITTDRNVNCICDKAPTTFQKITQCSNYFQHLAHLCMSGDDNVYGILLSTVCKKQGKETFQNKFFT